MFIKVLSTRHTAVGTFRHGIVYEVDGKDNKVKKSITPLLQGDNPALKEISAKEAKKIAEDVVSLVPKVSDKGLSDKEKLVKAEASNRDLEKENEALTEKLDAEIRAKAEAGDKLDAVTKQNGDLNVEIERLKKLLADQGTKIDALNAQLSDASEENDQLKAELDAASAGVSAKTDGKK